MKEGSCADYLRKRGLTTAKVARMVNRSSVTIENWYKNPIDRTLFDMVVQSAELKKNK